MGFVRKTFDSITGKSAAEDAAAAQGAATDASIKFQRDALDQTRGDLQPFREAGVDAIGDLRQSINQMPGQSNLDTSNINNFVNNGGRANLDQNVQAFLDPQAQADFLSNDPLYATLADDAERRINARMAASGKLNSGQTNETVTNALALLGRERVNDRLGQLTTGYNVASTNRSNTLQELLQGFNTDFNKANLDSNLAGQKTNSLFNLVTQGQNAAARQGAATQSATNAITNLTTAQGNANAAAETAAHNNLMSLVQGGMQAGAQLFGGRLGVA